MHKYLGEIMNTGLQILTVNIVEKVMVAAAVLSQILAVASSQSQRNDTDKLKLQEDL